VSHEASSRWLLAHDVMYSEQPSYALLV